MAAASCCRELGLDLYKIDLSQVVEQVHRGDREEPRPDLRRRRGRRTPILFFDEADALFGKRSEVRDSHDRYANIEISYLLQKMEEYEGVAILATNLRQNLDEAFARRLSMRRRVPVSRRRRPRADLAREPSRLTRRWPTTSTSARLAREVRLAGGNIKNIALAAAFVAAADGQVIRMDHLWHAAHREFGKLGRSWAGPLAGAAS